jgi:hypothetical protein
MVLASHNTNRQPTITCEVVDDHTAFDAVVTFEMPARYDRPFMVVSISAAVILAPPVAPFDSAR